ncbi:sugar ABC transporter substrate-binding protein [Streptomyces sp. NPDC001817]|uniref:sugar ABC transporter substrate-binding protein n=1 Tax=Streptomyces sp. NPDC001817 TaxID=3154398 RepID=UPI0033307A06
MRFRSVLCSTASALSALGLLSACGGDGGTTATSSGGKPLVGVDYPRSDTDFWNAYIKYTPEYAKRLGLSLKTTNSQNDVAKLAANAQTFILQGVKGIAMAPQSTCAIAPILAQLQAAKIPVVTIDTRPDTGRLYMVVRADNRAYGEKACRYLGTELGGKGKVVMLEGDLASINGRDRTKGFNDCMKKNYPGITVFGETTDWDGAVAAQKLQTDLTAHPDIKGIYIQSSLALSGTLHVLKQEGLSAGPKDKRHVFAVSNDGTPRELKNISNGGHESTIVRVRDGILEDQLSAPLVTVDGGTYGGVPSLKSTDTSLWGNSLG